MKYKHVVFDVDGTLIDTEYSILSSLQKTVRQIKNKDIALTDLKFALGITSNETLHRLGVTDTEKAISLWLENANDYFDSIKVFDGIKDTLDMLGKSCELGIITSRSRAEYIKEFLPFGLSEYFDTVICKDDTVEHKPNPGPMYKYLEITGADNTDTLYIGDSVYDMQCASGACVDCGLALWSRDSRDGIKATYYFNRPDEIVALL